MIGTWRQLQAQQNYQDATDLPEKFSQQALDDAIEVATTVKITVDVIDAFERDGTDGNGNIVDTAKGLAAALKALGFEVVQ